MFKSLDVLIGATTVLLLFSMGVTVVTQAFTSLLGRRGKHLKLGLADLLQQLGVSDRKHAEEISKQVLLHPLVADGGGKLGSVVHREEFTKLLLGFAGAQGARTLKVEARESLIATLRNSGITNPDQTLSNVADLALQLEASNPELANDVRDRVAILHGASSLFVARVNSWFDQTMDRIGQRFTYYTHGMTFAVAMALALGLQLNMVTVINRLSTDDQFRQAAAASALKMTSQNLPADAASADYFHLLDNAGVMSLPSWNAPVNWTKIPEILLTGLLISLGAPFWYNALKDLLRLRSTAAQKDDQQRLQRQSTQPADASISTPAADSVAPAWLRGERGHLPAVG